jgi:GDP-4-dehydro-6-deoxy-D-mannose reductase
MSGPVLVTGAQGFVGRHLLAELGDDAVPVEADVLDPGALSAALRELHPRAVVHLAARSWVAESWREPGPVWEVNVIGTVHLLQAVREERPEARVLVVSTGEVYGRAERLPTPEDAEVAPVSPYAASKAAVEIAGRQAALSGLDVVIARPFQHEGPGRDERFAVGSWAAQIAALRERGGGVVRVGDLSARRDITDVRDVCRAYRLLLDPSTESGVYNIASGTAVAMGDVLELLIELAGVPIEIEQDSERLRPAEIPVLCGDSSKLSQATGWRPTIPLKQTLADALAEAARTTSERIAKA